MWKCLIIFFCIIGVSFANMFDSVIVQTTNTMVLPPRNITSAVEYTTNHVYSQGSVVEYLDRFYWSVIGGVSSNSWSGAPVHAGGDKIDGTVTWRFFNNSKRTEVFIQNDSTNVVYLSEGFPSVLNKGRRLGGTGSAWWDDSGRVQSAIYAISTVTNNVLTVDK